MTLEHNNKTQGYFDKTNSSVGFNSRISTTFFYLFLNDGEGDLGGARPLDHVAELALPVEHLEIGEG